MESPARGPAKRTVYEDETTKAMCINFAAGQAVPPCTMVSLCYFYVVKGAGWLEYGGQEYPLAAGTLAVVPPGAERAIKAESDLVLLAVQVNQR
ncbi:MAG: cupin domain-containing protein [Moorellales bacterium]